jgi:hypothetical protein
VSVDTNGNAQVAMQEADATHKGVARLTTTATASADAQSDTTAITPAAVQNVVSGMVQTAANTAVNNKMWFGTKAQYDAIVPKDSNILYFITY